MTDLQNLRLLKKKVSPEIFTEFCKESEVCPECFSPLVVSRDEPIEIVCRKCGLVIAEEHPRQNCLPGHGADTHYKDTCQLAFGKSLGSYIDRYKMYSILKKTPNGVKNIGIRALQLKNITRIEKRQIQAMLSYGSECCKRYGLATKTNRSILFADNLGRVLRTCGLTALTLSRGTISSKKLGYACFLWLYKKTFNDGNNIQQELKVKPENLAWIDRVMHDIALPCDIELFGKTKAVRELFDDADVNCQYQVNPDWPAKGPLILAETTKREELVSWCSDDLPVLKIFPKKNSPED